ncbi:hypothetical protein [Erythrobacter sp. A6_0]|uniref:hypothetical protein n=1 Tax=Erythrobacter sp. A6_0 TaxID=2821089 RepID=UPI001AD98F97|nr:hypothetical protein [Erythrobacter sp. A6_0]MBO9511719.1 hypothetical protein [Erythrobacter sp. A6_0]
MAIVLESVIANAAILLGLALILGVFAPRLAFGQAAWGLGIVLLAGASWFQLAAPAPLANQLAGMAVAWGLWVAVSGRFTAQASGAMGVSADETSPPIMQAVLRALGRALLLFLVASPVQYGIIQASSIEPVSGLSLVGLGIYVLGFLLDGLRARRTAGRARWGMALIWWGLWIAAASAGWWVAAWTAIGPILATWLALRARSVR